MKTTLKSRLKTKTTDVFVWLRTRSCSRGKVLECYRRRCIGRTIIGMTIGIDTKG